MKKVQNQQPASGGAPRYPAINRQRAQKHESNATVYHSLYATVAYGYFPQRPGLVFSACGNTLGRICNGGIRRLIHRRKTAFLGRAEMHPVLGTGGYQVNAKVGFEPVTTPVLGFLRRVELRDSNSRPNAVLRRCIIHFMPPLHIQRWHKVNDTPSQVILFRRHLTNKTGSCEDKQLLRHRGQSRRAHRTRILVTRYAEPSGCWSESSEREYGTSASRSWMAPSRD